MLEKKISLSTFPISSAILMRSVLETTIKVHFEDSATPVTGELNAIFNEVVKVYGSEKALRSTINTIKSGNAQKHGSIQWFNLITHSADASVTAEDVRQAWKTVSPLLRRLLRPPTQPVSKRQSRRPPRARRPAALRPAPDDAPNRSVQDGTENILDRVFRSVAPHRTS